MLGIGESEIGAEKLRSGAEIDDAAVGVQTAADAGAPAIADIDRAGQPGFGRRNRRRGVRATVASLVAASAGGVGRRRSLRCGSLGVHRHNERHNDHRKNKRQPAHRSRFLST